MFLLQFGIIQLMGQTFFLQPLANHLLPGGSTKGKAHIVFRRTAETEITNGMAAVLRVLNLKINR